MVPLVKWYAVILNNACRSSVKFIPYQTNIFLREYIPSICSIRILFYINRAFFFNLLHLKRKMLKFLKLVCVGQTFAKTVIKRYKSNSSAWYFVCKLRIQKQNEFLITWNWSATDLNSRCKNLKKIWKKVIGVHSTTIC